MRGIGCYRQATVVSTVVFLAVSKVMAEIERLRMRRSGSLKVLPVLTVDPR